MRTHFEDLGIRAISRWLFNSYVIADAGGGRAVVVDAGLTSNAQSAVEILGDEAGRAIVVATHAHSDHVGGVPHIVTQAGAEVHLPAKTRDYIGGETPRTPGPRAVARIWPVFLDQPFDGASLGTLRRDARLAGYGQQGFRMPVDVGGFLDDGDRLPDAPDWEVVATPGHTDDSISFYNARTRTLCSGDAVLSIDGHAWFNPEYVDADAQAKTQARLRSMAVDTLLPGHGYPIRGHDLLTDALSFQQRIPHRLAFTCKAVSAKLQRRRDTHT